MVAFFFLLLLTVVVTKRILSHPNSTPHYSFTRFAVTKLMGFVYFDEAKGKRKGSEIERSEIKVSYTFVLFKQLFKVRSFVSNV